MLPRKAACFAHEMQIQTLVGSLARNRSPMQPLATVLLAPHINGQTQREFETFAVSYRNYLNQRQLKIIERGPNGLNIGLSPTYTGSQQTWYCIAGESCIFETNVVFHVHSFKTRLQITLNAKRRNKERVSIRISAAGQEGSESCLLESA